jgi:starch synthase
MMGRGIIFADIITTVSPSYAEEIKTPEFGEGLDPLLRDRSERLIGVLNGIDTHAWDPATDSALTANFNSDDLSGKAQCKASLKQKMGLDDDPDAVLIGLTSRLTDQKGFDLLTAVLEPMLRLLPVQFVIMGSGDQRYHHNLADLHQRYPDRLAYHPTYDENLARRIYAASDIFLMPSRHEPGGLDQLKAMRYGAIPVVHATGGLKDTFIDHSPPEIGTGFRFEPYDCMALFAGVVRALEIHQHPDIWQAMQRNAMTRDYSVDAAARTYRQLYRQARSLKLTGRPDAPIID